MASVTKAEFEAALVQATSMREPSYSSIQALHYHWEDDNTNAERDEESFKQLTQILGASTESYIIPKTERMPVYQVRSLIDPMIGKALSENGRSLIILHYAGHGNPNNLGELELCSLSGKKMAVHPIMSIFDSESAIPLDLMIDFLVIFDCCYSFLASRAPLPNSRLVEVLTSGDARDPIAFPAGTHNSLTFKLLVEIRSRAQRGDKRVEIADAIDTLRQNSPIKKPQYAPKLGLGSITLPLNPAMTAISINKPISTSDTPGMLATFSIHVSKTFDKQELQALVNWILQLPKTKSATLKLESIKETQSMLFIFEGSCLCFSRIFGLPGVILICENLPNDFSWVLPQKPSVSSSSRSRESTSHVNDENNPPLSAPKGSQ